MKVRWALASGIGALLALTPASALADAGDPHESGDARRYVVVLKDSVDHVGRVADAHEAEYDAVAGDVYRHVLNGYVASVPDGALDELRADQQVQNVLPDRVVRPASPPPNTEIPAPRLKKRQEVPTGVRRIGGLRSPTADIDGHDERINTDVAVIDTGLDAKHPDLNVVRTANCVGQRYRPDDHGTHVAGTVGALDNRIGVVGVAPGARIWSIRIFDARADTTLSTLLCAIDFVAAHQTIEVVNMSAAFLGFDGGDCGLSDDDPFHAGICALTESGTTFVASAGNNFEDTESSLPAAYDEVLAVSVLADYDGRSGSMSSPTCFDGGVDDHFAWFSNFGSDVDLIAPGVCILSSWWPRDYEYEIGSSQAAPHVAGAAALYYARHPYASSDRVRASLLRLARQGPRPGDPDGIAEPLVNVARL